MMANEGVANHSTLKAKSGQEFGPLLLTIPEFCAAFRTSRSAAYRLLKTGELRAVKRGARTLIARAEAEEWVARLPRYAPEVA